MVSIFIFNQSKTMSSSRTCPSPNHMTLGRRKSLWVPEAIVGTLNLLESKISAKIAILKWYFNMRRYFSLNLSLSIKLVKSLKTSKFTTWVWSPENEPKFKHWENNGSLDFRTDVIFYYGHLFSTWCTNHINLQVDLGSQHEQFVKIG